MTADEIKAEQVLNALVDERPFHVDGVGPLVLDLEAGGWEIVRPGHGIVAIRYVHKDMRLRIETPLAPGEYMLRRRC